MKEQKQTLFCYRCLKHIHPIRKKTISEYYYDIDNLPISAYLPHCPICGHEVYDHTFGRYVYEFKRYLFIKMQMRNLQINRIHFSELVNENVI